MCCGPYLPPETWPYTSRDIEAYREYWGRVPTAKLSAEQRASDEALGARLVGEAEELESTRLAYLNERNAVLVQAGLAEFVSTSAPMEL